MMGMITPMQRRFIDEYLIDLNATQAARRAGFSPQTSRAQGSRLLTNVDIQTAIAERQSQISEKLEIRQETIVARLWAIATADANDLIRHRLIACRYCWGLLQSYQWRSRREFEAADADAATNGQPAPSSTGGFGYSRAASPNPDCAECSGLGLSMIDLADTTALSGGAAMLFDGIRQTSFGTEIKLQNRLKALELLSRHLGMLGVNSQPKANGDNAMMRLISQLNKPSSPATTDAPD